MVVSIGVNERDGGTLYNAQLLFDADGRVIQHRRLRVEHLVDQAPGGDLDPADPSEVSMRMRPWSSRVRRWKKRGVTSTSTGAPSMAEVKGRPGWGRAP